MRMTWLGNVIATGYRMYLQRMMNTQVSLRIFAWALNKLLIKKNQLHNNAGNFIYKCYNLL